MNASTANNRPQRFAGVGQRDKLEGPTTKCIACGFRANRRRILQGSSMTLTPGVSRGAKCTCIYTSKTIHRAAHNGKTYS